MVYHYKTLLLVCSVVGLSSNYSYAFQTPINVIPSTSSLMVSVNAERSDAAEDFISAMANDAISFLGDESLSDADKQKRFTKLLTQSFDMNTIGRFALGRYWRISSAEQRKEYQNLFRSMIVDVYSRRFGEYNGQNLEIRGSRFDNEKDVTVNSFIVPQDGGQEIQVDWRVRKKNGSYKVIDVMVEGVSMALTQRSDFSSVIQRGGGEVSVLLAHLREQ